MSTKTSAKSTQKSKNVEAKSKPAKAVVKEEIKVEASSFDWRSLLTLRTAAIIAVIAAILISGYMSYTQLSPSAETACSKTGSFNCQTVEESQYSKLFGIPVAVLGLMTNISILGLLLLEDRIDFLRENGITLTFLVVFFAAIFSLYLIYLQAGPIGVWCEWCLSHEIAIFSLFAIVSLRLWNFFQKLEG